MTLDDAVALVTGATGGLGRRICRMLVQNRVHVFLGYHERRDEASRLAKELASVDTPVRPVQIDVCAPESVEAAVSEIQATAGRIDILVNNAAWDRWIPHPEVASLSLEEWSTVLKINLTGPLVCIRAVASIMKTQGRGRIVNIASIAGLAPTGGSIAYAVSKAGLIQLTRSAAVALAPEVLVNCVAPGFMEGTGMAGAIPAEYQERVKRAALLQHAADVDDVADVVLTLCRTNSMTGQTVVVDAGRVLH